MHDAPLAIIGMACRLPGAENLDEYWQLLQAGRYAVQELPPERFDRRLHYSPERGALAKSYTTIGGLVSRKPFDRDACPISEDLVARSDAAHLGFLEVAAAACRHAGFDPFGLGGARAGVYVGHTRGTVTSGDLAFSTMIGHTARYLDEIDDFRGLLGTKSDAVIEEIVKKVRADFPRRDSQGGPFLDSHRAASLVSVAFDLDGPAMSINAACASSLIALMLSARALKLGYLDMAIVGGASHFKFDSAVLFSKAQSASATASRPFDEAADGLVAAEGYVALVVKTLDKARADGDHVQAVIRGIGMASDGRGKSLWAPRKEGQIEAIRRAHGSGDGLGELQYIEAHATSTQIGDATEAAALSDVLRPNVPDGTKIPIGSAKSNIGHTLETAGMAGLLKTVLAMRHGWIPATINLERPSSKIDWSSVPFRVVTKLTPWPRPASGGPRRAAVNAFGIGGLNVHVSLEEFVPGLGDVISGSSPSRVRNAMPDGRHEPIAIVGVGTLIPGAHTNAAFGELLRSGRSALSEVPANDRDVTWAESYMQGGTRKRPISVGGFLRGYEYDWKRHKVPPKQVAHADPLQFMLLDAVDQALTDAGWLDEPARFPRQRTGVLVGTEFIGEFAVHLQVGMRLPEFHEYLANALRGQGLAETSIAALIAKYDEVFLSHLPAILDETGSFTSSTLASRITKTFDLMGGAAALDAGTASSHAALLGCVDALSVGDCDAMICAAGQRALGLCTFERLALGGALSSNATAGPWSGGANGVVPGEGAAVLVLKRLADARRDGDRIRGIIRGMGVSRSGDLRRGIVRSARQAMERSGAKPRDVGGVEAVACGVPQMDAAELSAIADVYGDAGREELPVVSHVTGQIGHAGGAAGLISIAKLTAELEEANVAAAVGVDRPAPYVVALQDRIHIAAAHAPLTPSESGRVCMASIGHGGNGQAYHAIIERAEPLDPRQRGRAQGVQPAAASRQVAESGGGRPSGRPKIAFLFSGQGSQYSGMLRSLVDEYAPAVAAMREMDAVARRLGYPRPGDVLWGDLSGQLGSDVWLTQYSLLIADTLIFRCLLEQGIWPDVVAGHSFGEFPALHAAGAWSFEACALATKARCDAIANAASAVGVMAASNAPVEEVQAACEHVGGGVYVSNHNGPRQTVFAGAERAVDLVARALHDRKYSTRTLPVPRPYHTPLMADTEAPFRSSLASIRLEPPSIPFLSSVTNRYVAEPDEIRDNLARQMCLPVRYVELIERLAHENVDVFIEVGPERILTRLHEQILSDTSVRCVATDHRQQGSLSCLRHATRTIGEARLFGGAARRSPAWAEPIADMAREPDSVSGSIIVDDESETLSSCTVAMGKSWEDGNVLILTGTRREMGLMQGTRESERLRRALRRYADLSGIPGIQLPELNDALGRVEELFTQDDLAEFAGIANGASVAVESVIAHHLLAYPDIGGGGCTHFAVRAAANGEHGLLHAANEDLPLGLTARNCLERNVQLRSGDGELAYLTFCIVGQAGGINGINEAGLTVTSTMLLDLPRDKATAKGMLHGMLVRRLLSSATSIDAALDILRHEQGSGGWSLCLSDCRADRLCYVEYDGRDVRVLDDQDRVLAANHALLHEARAETPRHSLRRLARLRELFDAWPDAQISREQAQTSFRDRFDLERRRIATRATMNTIRRVDNQFSVVFEPGAGVVWYAADNGSDAALAYQRIDIDSLFQSVKRTRANTIRDNTPNPTDPTSEQREAARSGEPVGRRFVLRTREIGRVDGGTPVTGNVLILGANRLSHALRERVRSSTTRTVVLPSLDDVDHTVALLERVWRSTTFPNLWITTPHDRFDGDVLDHASYGRRRGAGAMTPFFVAQRWLRLVEEAGLLERATITACTALGGDFGLLRSSGNFESGALTGLLKDLHLEIRHARPSGFRARIIDLGADQDAGVAAELILAELAAGNPETEVGYQNGRRLVIREYAQPLERLLEDCSDLTGSWIVTGGARGITSLVALELGRRFGCKLHLVGSTVAPDIPASWRSLSDGDVRDLRAIVCKEAVAEGASPMAAWQRVEKSLEMDRNLRRFADAGVQAVYHACDLSSAQAVRQLVATIRREDGRVQGVIHGAGYEKSIRFNKKAREHVERTFQAKIDGAVNLLSALEDGPPRYVVGFGSTSGRFGSVGQADYCAANEMLAKLLDWYGGRHPECRAASIHWTAWGEVGMATRPDIKVALEGRGIKFLPPREGVEFVLNELRAGLPEPEIVVTDWERHLQSYPDCTEPLPCTGSVISEVAATPTRATMSRPGTNVVTRFVPRLVKRPAPTASEAARTGSSIVLLGRGSLANAVHDRLAKDGHDVEWICNDDMESARMRLESLWRDRPRETLVLVAESVSHLVPSSDAYSLVARSYWCAEKWVGLLASSGMIHRGRLVAVTGHGGTLGLTREVPATTGGALIGLAKAIGREFTKRTEGIQAQVIDVPYRDSADSAALVAHELSCTTMDREVAYLNGERHVLELCAQHAEESGSATNVPRGTWVVTGGARGVTALAALHLAQRFGLKVHLLGSSPAPRIDPEWRSLDPASLADLKREILKSAVEPGEKPQEAWSRIEKAIEMDRNLQAFASAGIPAVYHECDVSCRDSVSQVLEEIRREDGRIDGILHGAGFERACRFEKKQAELVAKTINVKVGGAMNIMDLTAADPIRWFVAFGSISGRFGGVGQTDYCLANAWLAKLVDEYLTRRPECRATTVDWHSWDEVGMAVRPESKHIKALIKFSYMPTAEGVHHLENELLAGCPSREVVFTDPSYCQQFYPRSLDAERETPSHAPAGPKERSPLIESTDGADFRRFAKIEFDPARDPFLAQHQFKKQPLLPLVVAMEAMAQAVSATHGEAAMVGWRDVVAESPLKFVTSRALAVRVHMEEGPEGVACRLTSDFHNRAGRLMMRDRVHFRGEVLVGRFGDAWTDASEQPTLETLRRARPVTYRDDLVIYHGPAFRVLKTIDVRDEGCDAWMVAPPLSAIAGGRSTAGWLHSPVVLDQAFYACGLHFWLTSSRGILIPRGIRYVRRGKMPVDGESLIVRAILRSAVRHQAEYDFQIRGVDGALVIAAEGFQAAIVERGTNA